MSWLFPSVIATLTGTILLVLVYAYFYINDRKMYFGTWTLSWGVYSLRYIAMLVYISLWKHHSMLMVNQIAALVSGVLLLLGTFQFLGKRMHVAWWAVTGAGICWIGYSIQADLPFFIMSFPTFSLMAIVYIWTGLSFLRFDQLPGIEKQITGISFIVWGLHKANYPFLRPVEWFASWGYLLGALLEFLVALGIILVYFKKTRNELYVNQLKFKQLAEAIKDVFWIGSTDWTSVSYISPAYETIWGRTCDSLYRNPGSWADMIHPEDRHAVNQTIEQFDFRSDREVIFPEYRIIRPDGDVRWIYARAYPIRDDQGAVTGVAGVASDITKRKKVETSLLESEERVSTIFKAADNVSFIITDVREPEPIITEFSSGAERIFGYTRAEMIGRPVSVLHINEDVKRFPEVFAKMKEGKQGFRGEATLVRKNGKEFPALFASYPLFDERGHMYAALGVSVDISEQKKLESSLQQAHKLEAIGTLAGGIAHDVNNILGVILGNTELAMDDVQEGNTAETYLEEIKAASLRATDVVRQLLRFSRKSEPERIPARLDDIVNEVVKLMRATIPKSIDMVTSVSPGAMMAMVDTTQIHQVIMNLCTNAAHAMEENGGVLGVSLSETVFSEDTVVGLKRLPPGRYALLTVSDTGTGIAPEIQTQIFDPYFTTKDVGKGTGMGLSVVHGIVQSHDGAISVYSESGNGSAFRVYFPLIDSGKIEEHDPVDDVPEGNEHILVVDDEPALLSMLKHQLERLGYSVTAMNEPVEVLKAFRATPEKFDLMITDMTMPLMSGDQLTREILEIRPGLPVILCTGFSERMNESIAGSLGIKKLIEKPIDKRQLANALREVLDGGGSGGVD